MSTASSPTSRSEHAVRHHHPPRAPLGRRGAAVAAQPRSWGSTTPGPTTTSCGAACPTRRGSARRPTLGRPRWSLDDRARARSSRRRTSGTRTFLRDASPSRTLAAAASCCGIGAGRRPRQPHPRRGAAARRGSGSTGSTSSPALLDRLLRQRPRRPRGRVLLDRRRAHPARAGARPRCRSSSPPTVPARCGWPPGSATRGSPRRQGRHRRGVVDHVAGLVGPLRRRVQRRAARRRRPLPPLDSSPRYALAASACSPR